MELVFEMRELEAAGDSTAGEITVSGLRIVPPPSSSSEGHLFLFPPVFRGSRRAKRTHKN
jgi:hypothetical protein